MPVFSDECRGRCSVGRRGPSHRPAGFVAHCPTTQRIPHVTRGSVIHGPPFALYPFLASRGDLRSPAGFPQAALKTPPPPNTTEGTDLARKTFNSHAQDVRGATVSATEEAWLKFHPPSLRPVAASC